MYTEKDNVLHARNKFLHLYKVLTVLNCIFKILLAKGVHPE